MSYIMFDSAEEGAKDLMVPLERMKQCKLCGLWSCSIHDAMRGEINDEGYCSECEEIK